MSANLATLDLLKMRVIWNEGYGAIINVHDVTNKTLSHDSNYIVDMVMWPKFGNSSISMREVILTSILEGLDQKNCLFWGIGKYPFSWFRFNNLKLTLGMDLKFCTKRVKGKSQKVFRANSNICRSYRGKTGKEGPFRPITPSWIGLRYSHLKKSSHEVVLTSVFKIIEQNTINKYL